MTDFNVVWKNDQECMVGLNRIFIDDVGIINFIAIGEHELEIAKKIDDVIRQLGDSIDGPVNLLIDLNNAGKSSPEARRLWQTSSDNDKSSKTALFGLHQVAKVLASFVSSFTKRKNMRFFSTREDALDWLNKQ